MFVQIQSEKNRLLNKQAEQLYNSQMQVNHKTYQIPEQISSLTVRPLSWQDFKATPPQNTWFLAHIYWGINYQFTNQSEGQQPLVKVSVRVLPKSWVGSQDQKLLRHEYGHYLIGCLCALTFQKRINHELIKPADISFGDWCKRTLQNCLKEYCERQKQYDEDTCHYLHQHEQKEWQNLIKKDFMEHYYYFESRKKQVKQKDCNLIVPVRVNVNKRINSKGSERAITTKKSNDIQKIALKNFTIRTQIKFYKNIQNVLPSKLSQLPASKAKIQGNLRNQSKPK